MPCDFIYFYIRNGCENKTSYDNLTVIVANNNFTNAIDIDYMSIKVFNYQTISNLKIDMTDNTFQNITNAA